MSVAVTRAAESGDGLHTNLTQLGANVVSVPVIASAVPEDGGLALAAACHALGPGDTVAVTSVNGARALLPVPGPPAGVSVVAVGPATADVLDATPWRVETVASRHTALDLAQQLGQPRGSGRVLYVAAAEPRSGFTEALVTAGWLVEQVMAYRTVLVEPEAGAIAAACACDAIVFTSGSTVRGWLGAAPASATPLVVSMGPSTSAVAREHGLSVDREATEQTIAGLTSTIVDLLSVP